MGRRVGACGWMEDLCVCAMLRSDGTHLVVGEAVADPHLDLPQGPPLHVAHALDLPVALCVSVCEWNGMA